MGAQEVDRQVVLDKFLAGMGQHVLDDLAGKATLSVAQTLRSDRVVERWHLELIRLKGNTPPASEFGKKIEARIREASVIERKVRHDRHQRERLAKQTSLVGKKDASPVNLAQMTASLVQAQIIAGHEPDVPGALGLVVQIVKEVHQAIGHEREALLSGDDNK